MLENFAERGFDGDLRFGDLKYGNFILIPEQDYLPLEQLHLDDQRVLTYLVRCEDDFYRIERRRYQRLNLKRKRQDDDLAGEWEMEMERDDAMEERDRREDAEDAD